MGFPPKQSSEADLFSSSGRLDSSSSPPGSSSPAIGHLAETAVSPRHVLPKDLRAAIRQLDDQELARLLSAALAEQARRKKSPEESARNRRAEADVVSLPQGRLNAIRAAFKAGVTASRIARQFGISLSDVKRALECDAKKR
jgi:DNA-binding NarL/FixJ family response regulator